MNKIMENEGDLTEIQGKYRASMEGATDPIKIDRFWKKKIGRVPQAAVISAEGDVAKTYKY